MGIALAILGGLIAAAAFLNGAGISPSSAPQQAVQELRFVEAILGLVVLSIGCVLYRLTYPRAIVAAKTDPRIDHLITKGCRVDGLEFRAGDGAPIFEGTNSGGPWTPAQRDAVCIALRTS